MSAGRNVSRSLPYLSMLVVPAAYYLLFQLLPIAGSIVAFRRYVPGGSVFGEYWVGLRYFQDFLASSGFWRALRNNVVLSTMNLVLGFPVPIVFALLLNEVRASLLKRVAQTVSYLPRFLSMVVIAGLIKELLSPSTGIVNSLIVRLGGEKVFFLNEPAYFKPIFVVSATWQWTGWSAIVYLASISTIDPQLYEAAVTDGAGRWRQTLHVTIPSILPAIVITLVLRIGQILTISYEKILLLANPLTYESADVISTYVFRLGIEQGNFSLATAVGFAESVVAVLLVVGANWAARRMSETSLW